MSVQALKKSEGPIAETVPEANAGYLSGFGNGFETEALPGALPVGRNSPQKCPFGLYAEQLSGSPFTAPRTTNERSWLYRIRPTVNHWGEFEKVDTWLWRTAPASEAAEVPLAPMRWDPIAIPDEPRSLFDGIRTITTAGDAGSQAGMGCHVYLITRSMQDEYFYNADGEMLFVPQQGSLRICTEFGVIEIEPGEIAVIPRGVKIRVELTDGPARGYICENYGGSFTLPERGPIGANCLANQRDFLTPVAAYEDKDVPSRLFVKWGGSLWATTIEHSPLDVVAWHGNYAPYKYDLRRFSPVGPILFDHADPSIFTVLTSPSETPGTANIDFVIFSDRWMVAENTFRPPWYHMNVMSEFMGLVYGQYDAKPHGFAPGGISLHNTMLPHGPDVDAFEGASNAELKPHKLQGTMAFMFDQIFTTCHCLRRRRTGVSEGLRRIRATLEEEFQPPSTVKGADMQQLDFTHDPALRSWVPGADGHSDFPIQNLPFCVFTPPGGEARGGVGIGSAILDLGAVLEAGLLDPEAARAADASRAADLNELFSLGGNPRRALRTRLSQLLSSDNSDISKVERCLVQTAECVLHLPSCIGDYTDFYVGIHHATNIGKQFRPDNPLLPNYKYVPIGYHGRASSVCPSGVSVRRPTGQFKPSAEASPVVGPAQRLDYELELGIWIGSGNALGDPISIENAADHIAGYCLLNDWSARDLQAWEYQPLGPFLSKNFATTLSPWVITPEALLPFQAAQQKRPEGDPAPLPYLLDEADQASGAFDIELEVLLITPALKRKGLPPHRLALSNTRHMYWSPRQMIAHHTVGGCNLRSGDLFGSGTISAPDPDGFGSMLESTHGGTNPIRLASDEERRFLEDGDEIILRAHGKRAGYVPIGSGECRATILSAHRAD